MIDSEGQDSWDSWGLAFTIVISAILSCVCTRVYATRPVSPRQADHSQQNSSMTAVQTNSPRRDPYKAEPRQGYTNCCDVQFPLSPVLLSLSSLICDIRAQRTAGICHGMTTSCLLHFSARRDQKTPTNRCLAPDKLILKCCTDMKSTLLRYDCGSIIVTALTGHLVSNG